jgi:hypothetical protein
MSMTGKPMTKTDKPESRPTSSLQGDIPAVVMAKLQAAYQASGSSLTEGCPELETVIVYALEELIPEKQDQVYAHLSKCKDCLDLVLDLRSAWAETEGGKPRVRERTPISVQVQSWLGVLADGMSGLLPRFVPLRRLIPAAVALVVLAVVGLGVFQHLTAPTSGQPPLTLTRLKPGTTYNYPAGANVSSGAIHMVRTNGQLPFLPLLLRK